MIAKSAKSRVKRVKTVGVRLPTSTMKESTTQASADAKKPERSAGAAGTAAAQCIEFVKSFISSPCSCYYPMASSAWGMNEDGSSFFKHDPGPKRECMRCKARRALDADGIEYDKDAKPPRTFLSF